VSQASKVLAKFVGDYQVKGVGYDRHQPCHLFNVAWTEMGPVFSCLRILTADREVETIFGFPH
jgi:hypothetical protein